MGLNSYGINPTIAEDGVKCLELLEKLEFDLILMDLLMPNMDGHEATVKIRKSNKPYKKIPIIAMTANVMADEIEKCKNEGMQAHVTKPINFMHLHSVLVKYLPVSTHVHKVEKLKCRRKKTLVLILAE